MINYHLILSASHMWAKINMELCATAAKLLQSCPTLWYPIDSSPPGSPVSGILQARTLQWVAISFSNAWKWKVKVKSLSPVQLFATPWTAAYQAPLPMGFSRQESGVGCCCLLVYICQCYSPSLSHPPLPTLCPQVILYICIKVIPPKWKATVPLGMTYGYIHIKIVE